MKTLQKNGIISLLFWKKLISHIVGKFIIIWCNPKLIDCVFAIRFAKWIFFRYRSNTTIQIAQYWLKKYKNWVLLTTMQILFGNPYHRWVLENQGFRPQTAQRLLLPLVQAGRVCTLSDGIIPSSLSSNVSQSQWGNIICKISLVILIGL